MVAKRFIKKVINKRGQSQYYYGDGLWFGRISRDEAEIGIATGKYTMWETKTIGNQMRQDMKKLGWN